MLRLALDIAEATRLLAGTFLTRSHYDRIVTCSAVGIAEGEVKFVFLRNALSSEGVEQAWCTLRRLRFGNVRQSHRMVFRRSCGGELVMGWLPAGPQPRRTRPTQRFPLAYGGVIQPLCFGLSQLVADCAEYLPAGYCQRQAALAAANGNWLAGAELSSLSGERGISIVEADGAYRPFTDADIATSLFSSVTINDSVICPAHHDEKNSSGFSCLTTFGSWSGGLLCFPRLRVAVDVRPGDVLIADMQEQHGNIAPLVGRRISVVAYLRACHGAN
jgi:hypothetical protein